MRLDPTFAPGGIQFAPGGIQRDDFTGVHDAAAALAVAGDRIVVAGAITRSHAGIARYVAP
jgi:hypothetical protein